MDFKKLLATIVSSRAVGIKRRSEGMTMSSHGDTTLRMKGKGGGRQRLKHVDGGVPLCMRSKDDEKESKPKENVRSSSSRAKYEDGS